MLKRPWVAASRYQSTSYLINLEIERASRAHITLILQDETMGLKAFLKKDRASSSNDDVASHITGSEKDSEEQAYGQNTDITTGWTGDGFAGASEYPNAPGENYRTLGRWRACVILITIEVGIGILSLPSALKTLGRPRVTR